MFSLFVKQNITLENIFETKTDDKFVSSSLVTPSVFWAFFDLSSASRLDDTPERRVI